MNSDQIWTPAIIRPPMPVVNGALARLRRQERERFRHIRDPRVERALEMAVSVDNRAAATAAGGGVTTIDLTGLTVGAGANRALTMQISFGNDGASLITAFWDPVGANQQLELVKLQAGATSSQVGIWGLVAPVSGNKVLRVSWTTASTVIVYGVAYIGVDQTGGATTFYSPTGSTATSAAPTISIASATNDWTVAALVCPSANPSAPTQTPDYIDTSRSDQNGAGSDATGAATVVHAWTISASELWAMAACGIKAFGGGGGPTAAEEAGIFDQQRNCGSVIGRVDA